MRCEDQAPRLSAAVALHESLEHGGSVANHHLNVLATSTTLLISLVTDGLAADLMGVFDHLKPLHRLL